MWADAEIGGQMTEGLEHISQIAKGEFTKDMEMLNHKIQSARLVFDWHWIVGCCIALFAAVSSNIGLNLQRLSHLENQFVDPFAKHKREKPLSQQVGVCARPRWVLGISLMIVASLADFAALSFAAQSLVASLGSLSLVANALIAPLIVKEKITSREWKAIGLICIGDACCILFGQHKSEVYTLDALMDLYGETPFIVYAIFMAIAIVSIWFSIYWIETVYAPTNIATAEQQQQIINNNKDNNKEKDTDNNANDKETNSNDTNDARTSISSERSEIQVELSSHQFSFTYDPNGCVAKYHRFSHAMLSGILGAQSVLLGKSTAELIKTLIAGRGNLFLHMGTYVILISMVLCIVTQVHYLNEALKRVEATIVVPVFQTFWTLISVIGGMVMYKEYHDLRFEQVMMFCVGLGLVLIGVQIMSQRRVDSGSSSEGTGNGNDEDDTKKKKKRRAKQRSKQASGSSAGTGGSEDFNENSTHSTGDPRPSLSDNEDFKDNQDDQEEDEEEDEPTEVESLLGGSRERERNGMVSPPTTPVHDSYSHLGSACSFPGVLIDSAARSVSRRPKRTNHNAAPPQQPEHISNIKQKQQIRSAGNLQYADDCV